MFFRCPGIILAQCGGLRQSWVGWTLTFAQTLLKDFAHHNKGFSNFCAKYALDFKTYAKYDGTSIEERQKLLFDLVKLIWA